MGVGFIIHMYVFNTKSATGKYIESGSPTKGQSSEFGNQKGTLVHNLCRYSNVEP